GSKYLSIYTTYRGLHRNVDAQRPQNRSPGWSVYSRSCKRVCDKTTSRQFV
ncbi:MAG: hypothetical protein AVDCRST_MAG93-3372, partial [uncultured Chloroflexia bacterium]